jgi:hypothetical protein
MNDERMVTLPASVLGTLLACSLGMLTFSVACHGVDGQPLSLRMVELIDAISAAEAAIVEAR